MQIQTEEIQEKVQYLGSKITQDYKGKDLVIIPILTGGLIFSADLVRNIDLPLQIEPIYADSYNNDTKSKGKVTITTSSRLIKAVHNRHMLLVDDVIDTGLTVEKIYDRLKQFNPLSMQTATLLLKHTKYKGVRPAYVGFEVEDKFVYGYGMNDTKGLNRNLSYIKAIGTNMVEGDIK